MTGMLLEGEMIVEDRTGGFTEFGSGFEKLRENLAAQRTLSGTISPAFGNTQPGAISVDALTEAFLKSIEVVLLATDIRRSSLYDSIATALLQRISNEAEAPFTRASDDDLYAESEPREQLQDAARLFRFIHSSAQTSHNEYMDEDEPT